MPRARPSLVALEGRSLPSTITWANPAGGDWSVPGNWTPAVVPGPDDDVVIDGPDLGGPTIHHTAGADTVHGLTLHGAGLRVESGSSLTAAGPADLDGASAGAAGGATLRLPGLTAVNTAQGVSLSAGGAGSLLDVHNLTTFLADGPQPWNSSGLGASNGGRADFSGLTAVRNLSGMSELNVRVSDPGSWVDLTSLASFTGRSASTVGAGGTLALSPGTTTLSDRVSIFLVGTLTVGTLRLNGAYLSGPGTLAGSLVVDGGGTVGVGFGHQVLTVTGNYTQAADGRLLVAVDGARDQYDHFQALTVGGSAALGGTLELRIFITQPSFGDWFQPLAAGSCTGTFASLTGDTGSFSFFYVRDEPGLPAGLLLMADGGTNGVQDND
jgi:hypothetical protein